MSQENIKALLKLDATQLHMLVILPLNEKLTYYKDNTIEITLITVYLSTLYRVYHKSVQGEALNQTVLFMSKFVEKYRTSAKLAAIGDNSNILLLRSEFKRIFKNLMDTFDDKLDEWDFGNTLEMTVSDRKKLIPPKKNKGMLSFFKK